MLAQDADTILLITFVPVTNNHKETIMNGTIEFNNAAALAKFLKEFTGCTAIFEVKQLIGDGFILTFKGGF